MNSFKLTAVGNLARNPELGTTGDATFARFCLVGKDEIEEGEQDRPPTRYNESLVLCVRRHRVDDRAPRRQGRPAHPGGEGRCEPMD